MTREDVISNETRKTMGDISYTSLTYFDRFCIAIHSVVERYNR